VESLCAISLHALSESVMVNEGSPSVLQLKGWLNGHQVLLLVDSGSTVSFVNRKLAASLSGITATPVPLRVKVADDRELVCNEEILNCQWSTQGHQFHSNYKLLSLGVFEIILGQDWLYHHSPMNID
jgi:hypothetical protein